MLAVDVRVLPGCGEEGLAISVVGWHRQGFHRATGGHQMPDSGPTWIKAAQSQGTGACVELALSDEGVAMRNSRHPAAEIAHTPTEFAVFVEAVKNGEFDHLVPPDLS